MPQYHYTCAEGHVVQVEKKMSDPHPERCPARVNKQGEIVDAEDSVDYCGEELSRVFHPLPFRFK